MPTEIPTGNRAVLDAWTRALKLTATIDAQPHRLLADVIEAIAVDRSEAPALLSDDVTLSYRALAQRINSISRWALAQNIQKGDVVGLLMPNQPDYLAIWLGLTRIGVVVALLNDQLPETALAHCLGHRRAVPSHRSSGIVSDSAGVPGAQ